MMNYHVLTLFPEMMEQTLNTSIIGRAIEKGILTLEAVDIRDYADNKHHKVDDYPYGGGAGMVMQAEPVYQACRAVQKRIGRKARVVYVTPQGRVFDQKLAGELAREEEIIFLCGHYEGIDERVLEEVVTDYVSIGDYVLTGGELAAMVMIDAVSRLVPGVLSNEESAQFESFGDGLLEYPQYSRPEEWRGKMVPPVLLSGNHPRVEEWRKEQSILRTRERRPDLYEVYARERQEEERLHPPKRKIRAVVFELSACIPDAALYIEEILKLIGERGLKCWLVSDRSKEETEALLQSWRLGHFFDRLSVKGGREEEGQEAEHFLENPYAELLREEHLPGKGVLAFVSSREGVRQAQEAGIRTVRVCQGMPEKEKEPACFRQISDYLEGMAVLRKL